MVSWSNYQALSYVVPMYLGIGGLFVFPKPLNIAFLLAGLGVTFFLIGAAPTIAKWVAQKFKPIWATLECLSKVWRWPDGRMLFLSTLPVHSTYDKIAKEWTTYLYLDPAHPYRHPYYNRGKRLYIAIFKHGWYSVIPSDEGLTDDDKYRIGEWEQLFPKSGGGISFASYWVFNSNTDSCWIEEVLPSNEELRYYEESKGKINIPNRIPVLIEGVAHPVFRIKRATGSLRQETEWRKERVSRLQGIESPTVAQMVDNAGRTVLTLSRCKACGAPAKEDATECGYCGAKMQQGMKGQ